MEGGGVKLFVVVVEVRDQNLILYGFMDIVFLDFTLKIEFNLRLDLKRMQIYFLEICERWVEEGREEDIQEGGLQKLGYFFFFVLKRRGIFLFFLVNLEKEDGREEEDVF